MDSSPLSFELEDPLLQRLRSSTQLLASSIPDAIIGATPGSIIPHDAFLPLFEQDIGQLMSNGQIQGSNAYGPRAASRRGRGGHSTRAVRLPVACHNCRIIKKKCSGGDPCATCIERGTADSCVRAVRKPRLRRDQDAGRGILHKSPAELRAFHPSSPPSAQNQPNVAASAFAVKEDFLWFIGNNVQPGDDMPTAGVAINTPNGQEWETMGLGPLSEPCAGEIWNDFAQPGATPPDAQGPAPGSSSYPDGADGFYTVLSTCQAHHAGA